MSANKFPIVYLCGGINGLSDAECNDWRAEAKRHLPHTLDPMRRDHRGRENDNGVAIQIVNGDLEDIAQSDVILAMCPRPSWGTAMEIFHGHELGKPVIAVVPNLTRQSPWLSVHATLVPNLAVAIAEINRRFS